MAFQGENVVGMDIITSKVMAVSETLTTLVEKAAQWIHLWILIPM